MLPESLYFWYIQNSTIIEAMFPSKWPHVCKYTLQSATVNVLETFPEDILWKPFQLLRRIPNDVIGITKAHLQ